MQRAAKARAPLVDPRADEPWFEALSEKRRDELTAEWRRDVERVRRIEREDRWRMLREVVGAGALFLVFDMYLCAQASLRSALVLLVAGLLTGFLWTRLDTCRLVTPVIAMVTFGAALVLSRGGVVAQHMFIVFLMGGVCSWIGVRREERLMS